MLTADMKALISRHTLGFVATVNEQGRPNLSPKGTFVVLGDTQLMFAEIRSPNTVSNIIVNPAVEVNFIDPFKRKGVRIQGTARLIEKQDEEFNKYFPYFDQWAELKPRIRRLVNIKINQASALSSPIYDLGVTEQELVENWTRKFQDMYQPPTQKGS